MRVGVIGPDHPDSFADNVATTLELSGVSVLRLGPARPGVGSRLSRGISEVALSASVTLDEVVQRRLARRARDFQCDVVISTDARLMPSVVAMLRSGGTRVALWFPDAVANLGRQLMLVAPYHAVYFKDPQLVDRLQELTEVPVRYLPEACNPVWHRPFDEIAPRRHIAVVGNMYPSRVALLNRLLRDQVPLVLYGAGVPRWLKDQPVAGLGVRPAVFRETKARVFREAAAVLNNLHPAEMTGVNARLFEATGSGGVVLCEHRRALAELFAPDAEVLAFRNYPELLDLVHRVLAAPAEVRSVGDAAAKRAHAEHTYEHRLRVILEDLA